MSPTSDQLKAAEETTLRRIIWEAVRQDTGSLSSRNLTTETIWNAISSLLSEREAKARREGAEKVVNAVVNCGISTWTAGTPSDLVKAKNKGHEAMSKVKNDAARQALNDLK